MKIKNPIPLILLTVILCVGAYYRVLAVVSGGIQIRNGFESAVSMASYLFINPATSPQGSLIKPQYSIYDSFSPEEYSKVSDGTDKFTFWRNPKKITGQDSDGLARSRSELGWAFILRYVLSDGMSDSFNMVLRILKFLFILEMILIVLMFYIGKQVAGLLGAVCASFSYAIFCAPVHMMMYISYYYWAIPFAIFSMFFWVVLYGNERTDLGLPKKIALFLCYGMVMGFATATRMIFLYLPLFLSPFILYKERKFKPALLLLIAMLCGQFLLLLPQMFVNKSQFGKFAITTRDTWHAVLTGVGYRPNTFGIANSGDYAVYDYIKNTTGVDIYKDGMDAYNIACRKQALKLIRENPRLFIDNALSNISTSRNINPTAFFAIDFPIREAPGLTTIGTYYPRSRIVEFIREYIGWFILLTLIMCFWGSHEVLGSFLNLLAHNIYMVLVICLYFPNYFFYMSGFIPTWLLAVTLPPSIIAYEFFLHAKAIKQLSATSK